MTSPFHYSTTFVLDKAHFNECFSESVPQELTFKDYYKAMAAVTAGIALLFLTDVIPHFAWFIIGLGIVEALSVYYRQPWWVFRQMLGKTANSIVTLGINDEGISTHSVHLEQTIPWSDVTQLQATAKGWLVFHAKGKNYISNSCLNPQAQSYLSQKAEQLTRD